MSAYNGKSSLVRCKVDHRALYKIDDLLPTVLIVCKKFAFSLTIVAESEFLYVLTFITLHIHCLPEIKYFLIN